MENLKIKTGATYYNLDLSERRRVRKITDEIINGERLVRYFVQKSDKRIINGACTLSDFIKWANIEDIDKQNITKKAVRVLGLTREGDLNILSKEMDNTVKGSYETVYSGLVQYRILYKADDNRGIVDLKNIESDCVSEYNTGFAKGYKIDISKLPKCVKSIIFLNQD